VSAMTKASHRKQAACLCIALIYIKESQTTCRTHTRSMICHGKLECFLLNQGASVLQQKLRKKRHVMHVGKDAGITADATEKAAVIIVYDSGCMLCEVVVRDSSLPVR